MRIVWETAKRIINEILRVKGWNAAQLKIFENPSSQY